MRKDDDGGGHLVADQPLTFDNVYCAVYLMPNAHLHWQLLPGFVAAM